MPVLHGAAAADKQIGELILGLGTSHCNYLIITVHFSCRNKHDVASDLSTCEGPPAQGARGELLA